MLAEELIELETYAMDTRLEAPQSHQNTAQQDQNIRPLYDMANKFII